MSNLINNIESIYKEIVLVINNSKNKIAAAINSEMILLYWSIGKIVKIEILNGDRAEYGKKVIKELSKELILSYGKGYSQRNLFNMVKLYDAISDFDILQTLSAKLSWYHLLKLIKINDSLKREFYITMCVNERWNFASIFG